MTGIVLLTLFWLKDADGSEAQIVFCSRFMNLPQTWQLVRFERKQKQTMPVCKTLFGALVLKRGITFKMGLQFSALFAE